MADTSVVPCRQPQRAVTARRAAPLQAVLLAIATAIAMTGAAATAPAAAQPAAPVRATAAPGSSSAPPSSAADDITGRRLFISGTQPPCATCHALSAAGATGQIGPALDELKPDAQRVEKAIRAGIGLMPAYPQLSNAEVAALARYVARASGAQP